MKILRLTDSECDALIRICRHSRKTMLTLSRGDDPDLPNALANIDRLIEIMASAEDEHFSLEGKSIDAEF
jgi:hypothetical protein